MTAVFSRRGVLGVGALALGTGIAAAGHPASAAIAPEHGAAAQSAMAGVSVAEDRGTGIPDPMRPVRSLFTGQEGSVYVGMSPWAENRLVLDAVGDLPGGDDPEHRFRVEFTAPAGARDGLYRLLRGGAHIASLYLVSVADGALEGIVDRQGRSA
ncbi:hypothetical protein [Microbacterium sp. XT11]|uniref:hypothetical protein n=1 Tax=Microbacterium sp. XT11 TaxID=367477 RepID=UPI0008321005|nr:hypothetical protein [Microbacterium sp. XT11]